MTSKKEVERRLEELEDDKDGDSVAEILSEAYEEPEDKEEADTTR
jgi:hypothetical protein